MQLYQGEPAGPGGPGEMGDSGPSLAPYPILLRIPYLTESHEPTPVRAAAKPPPAPETPHYLDASNPPPVRTPERDAAPLSVETPPMPAAPVEASTPLAKPTPPAKPMPYVPPPQKLTPQRPTTHGKLVGVLLLFVMVGLCVHWHWAALAPYCECPSRVVNLLPSRAATEMVIVPAEGAPMLAEPIAAPVAVAPCCEDHHACPPPTEPGSTTPAPAIAMKPVAAVAAPVEVMKPATTVVTRPVPAPERLPEATLGTPAEAVMAQPAKTTRPMEPIVPVSAPIPKPTFETRTLPPTEPMAAAEVAPVEAELGFDSIPTDEGSTP